AQGIKLGQTAADVAPFFYRFRALRRRRKKRPQGLRRVVVEAQIPRGELLFENRHPREQRHRSALDAVRRPQPYLALTLEKRARNPPADVFGKRQRAVVEIKVKIRPVNRGTANVEHAFGIESHRTNPRIKPARGLRTLRVRSRRLRRSRRCEEPCQPDHRPRPSKRQLHKSSPGGANQLSPALQRWGSLVPPAPKGASDCERLTASLKRCPDTKP